MSVGKILVPAGLGAAAGFGAATAIWHFKGKHEPAPSETVEPAPAPPTEPYDYGERVAQAVDHTTGMYMRLYDHSRDGALALRPELANGKEERIRFNAEFRPGNPIGALSIEPLMRAADAAGDGNEVVSRQELRETIDSYTLAQRTFQMNIMSDNNPWGIIDVERMRRDHGLPHNDIHLVSRHLDTNLPLTLPEKIVQYGRRRASE